MKNTDFGWFCTYSLFFECPHSILHYKKQLSIAQSFMNFQNIYKTFHCLEIISVLSLILLRMRTVKTMDSIMVKIALLPYATWKSYFPAYRQAVHSKKIMVWEEGGRASSIKLKILFSGLYENSAPHVKDLFQQQFPYLWLAVQSCISKTAAFLLIKSDLKRMVGFLLIFLPRPHLQLRWLINEFLVPERDYCT